MVLVYHDVRAPPKDYNRLDRHSRTVSFVHSHVRSSLAYIFSGAAQGACALRVTVGHCSMSDVSLTSFLSRAFYSNATLAYLIIFLASRSVAVGQCTMSDATFDNPWRVRGR